MKKKKKMILGVLSVILILLVVMVVNGNTYQVDEISGATISSRTIQSAVCKALLQGLK